MPEEVSGLSPALSELAGLLLSTESFARQLWVRFEQWLQALGVGVCRSAVVEDLTSPWPTTKRWPTRSNVLMTPTISTR